MGEDGRCRRPIAFAVRLVPTQAPEPTGLRSDPESSPHLIRRISDTPEARRPCIRRQVLGTDRAAGAE